MACIDLSKINWSEYRKVDVKSDNKAWNHVDTYEKVGNEGNLKKIWICKCCKRGHTGNVARVEAHLGGVAGFTIVSCPAEVPLHVKQSMALAANMKKYKAEENKKRKYDSGIGNSHPNALQSGSSRVNHTGEEGSTSNSERPSSSSMIAIGMSSLTTPRGVTSGSDEVYPRTAKMDGSIWANPQAREIQLQGVTSHQTEKAPERKKATLPWREEEDLVMKDIGGVRPVSPATGAIARQKLKGKIVEEGATASEKRHCDDASVEATELFEEGEVGDQLFRRKKITQPVVKGWGSDVPELGGVDSSWDLHQGVESSTGILLASSQGSPVVVIPCRSVQVQLSKDEGCVFRPEWSVRANDSGIGDGVVSRELVMGYRLPRDVITSDEWFDGLSEEEAERLFLAKLYEGNLNVVQFFEFYKARREKSARELEQRVVEVGQQVNRVEELQKKAETNVASLMAQLEFELKEKADLSCRVGELKRHRVELEKELSIIRFQLSICTINSGSQVRALIELKDREASLEVEVRKLKDELVKRESWIAKLESGEFISPGVRKKVFKDIIGSK